jgi:hypothetical protein
MKAKLIKPNNDVVEVSPRDGEHFTLDELRELLDCEMVEVITPPSKTGFPVMVIDEEGKLNGKPLNEVATAAWQDAAQPGSMRMEDPIVGNALLCHYSQIQ